MVIKVDIMQTQQIKNFFYSLILIPILFAGIYIITALPGCNSKDGRVADGLEWSYEDAVDEMHEHEGEIATKIDELETENSDLKVRINDLERELQQFK